jgi:outer membrane immunogenic protein
MEATLKRFCLASVSLVALATAASAADLGRPAPYYPPAAPVYAPAFSWTGFYVGVNGGGGWGRSGWDSTGTFDVSGGLVGGTVGYNYQTGWAVFGAEGDIDWSGIKGTTNNACAPGCTTGNTWLSTIRGRFGYAAGQFMPYVTGGVAFGNIQASEPGFAGNSDTNAGWTLGGGLEYAFAHNWSAKAEYLYVDLGNFNCGTACGPGVAINNVSFRTNILRGGINYRF